MCGQWSSGRHIITHMHTLNCFFANDSFVLFLPVSKKRLNWKWPFEDCTCGPIFSFLITYFGLIVTLGTIKKAASFIINNLIRVLGPRSQCKCYPAARPFPKPLKELYSHFVSKWHWRHGNQTHSHCNMSCPHIMDGHRQLVRSSDSGQSAPAQAGVQPASLTPFPSFSFHSALPQTLCQEPRSVYWNPGPDFQ